MPIQWRPSRRALDGTAMISLVSVRHLSFFVFLIIAKFWRRRREKKTLSRFLSCVNRSSVVREGVTESVYGVPSHTAAVYVDIR